jgi:hypothetical protein
VLQGGDRVAVLAATGEADDVREFLSREAGNAAREAEGADSISAP